MSASDVAAINHAATVLITIVLALMTAWSAAHERAIGKLKNGGGHIAATLPVLKLPLWNQLNDPLPDGTQDRFATTDCGEECAAEVIRACTGVTLSAGDVRYQLGGPDRIGLTTGADLAAALAENGVTAASLDLAADEAWRTAATNVGAGKPVLALIAFQGTAALHWIAITAVENGILHYNDPWGGYAKRFGKGQWAAQYKGTLVRVDTAVKAAYLG